jgi:hypothetical protein
MESLMPDNSYSKPNNMNDLAHRLARLGYNIVPIHIGRKGPTFANWQNYECTPDNINRDFPPQGIVIGVKHDRLGCVDVDVYDADLSAEIRDEFLRRFPRCLERVGQAPKTALVFRLPDDPYTVSNTTKRKKKGVEAQVEIRTKTGQMVAYGKHPDTKQPYRWTRGDLWETPIESLPMLGDWEVQEFRDWAEAKIKAWAEEDQQPVLAPVIDLGAYAGFSSNEPPTEEAVREALSYIPADLSYQDWLQVLMALHDYYNGSMRGLQVAQDWSSRYADYNAKEVDAKWRSFKGTGVKYSTLFHYAKMHGADLSELARRHRKDPASPQQALQRAVEPQVQFDAPTQPVAAHAAPAQIFWASEAQPVLASAYLVKGWLGAQQMSVVYAPSNVGKSFFCLDIAYCVAAGIPWQGCKVRGGPVLYLATEGGNAFRNRVYALQQEYGAPDVPLAVRPSPVNLLNPEADLPALGRLCSEIEAEHGKLALIVVDTLSRAIAGGNENGPEDMTAFIANVDALRDFTGAHVMIVHHTGKDTAQGARGHSSLRAATDTEIEIENDDGLRTATATKQRDLEPKAPITFQLKVHEIGNDDDGDAVTTCTIMAADPDLVEDKSIKRPHGKNQKLVKNAFQQLRGEGVGQPNPSGAGFPEPGRYWCIAEQKLREFCYGKITSTNKVSAYTGAVDGLLSSGYMVQNEGLLWIAAKEGKVG